MAETVTISEVGDAGVGLQASEDLALDVLFDGRRIWSFWSRRDAGDGHVEWPAQLRGYLDGHARVSLVEHVSSRVLFDEQVSFGSADKAISIVDAQGRPLGLDKSNRLAATFDTRDREQVEPLLDGVEQLIAALREAGIEAFLAYGTLLGAVREGDFIGHDSDVDLGYVSRCTTPVDMIRESFRVQRALAAQGFPVHRYSGAAFKVDVREADGGLRGLDVFGGFFFGGSLYLMGEIGTPFEQDWIFPLTSATLAGRRFPVPARPEKLLEATYGASWRVPDPAFHFETPPETVRSLNGWFRGLRTHRAEWDRRYSGKRELLPKQGPSALAQHVLAEEGPSGRVVDLGAGRGADALWLARQGVEVYAADHAFGADNAARRVAAEEGLSYETVWLNLHEPRSVIAQGARMAHLDGPTTVMSNHLLDATDRRGLAGFARFCRMALSGGGRLYADFLASPGPGRGERGKDLLQPVSAQAVADVLREAGAHIVSNDPVPADGDDDGRQVARVVAQWRQ